MAIDADKIYLLIFIPIIIIAAVFIKKKFIKGDRYINASTALRTLTVISLILSLSGMSVTDRAKNDTTLFLADISESVSAQKERVAEFINSAQSHKETGDKTAVSLFGGRAVTAVSPTEEFVNANLDNSSTENDNTNIEAAIKQAVSAFDGDTRKRLVIITDGLETRGDALAARNVLNSENISTLIYDIGGGIKSDEDIEKVFACGASMVTVGSISVTRKDLFVEWIAKFGAERIILGADVRDGKISINGWLEDTTEDIVDFLEYYVSRGVKNVLCTDISKDGMLQGPAYPLYEKILAAFPGINLIASGGVSCADDIRRLDSKGVPSVVFGKAVYEGKIDLKALASYVVNGQCCMDGSGPGLLSV